MVKMYHSSEFNKDDFIADCPNYKFVPTILPATERIIAVGDIMVI